MPTFDYIATVNDSSKVDIFLSWSGPASKQVAIALRTWLPRIFDSVKPWASDRDIDAGTRSMSEIEAHLSVATFGIVIVDSSNHLSTWLNFEAGALSRAISDSENYVVPLLLDFDDAADLSGPISQFQAKLANRDGIADVVGTLARHVGVDSSVAQERFDMFWSQLEAVFISARGVLSAEPAPPPKRDADDKLDEIINLLRSGRTAAPNRPTVGELSPEFKIATSLAQAAGIKIISARNTPDLMDISITDATDPFKADEYRQQVADQIARTVTVTRVSST